MTESRYDVNGIKYHKDEENDVSRRRLPSAHIACKVLVQWRSAHARLVEDALIVLVEDRQGENAHQPEAEQPQ